MKEGEHHKHPNHHHHYCLPDGHRAVGAGKEGPKMNLLYKRLKGELRAHDITIEYLAQLLDRSATYVAYRTAGYAPWSQDDMYFIMNAVNWPVERMHELFPPRPKEQKRRRYTRRNKN